MDNTGWKSFDFGPSKNARKTPTPTSKQSKAIDNELKILKPIRTNCSRKIKSSSSRLMNSLNFQEKLKPTLADELAVHPKKIQEIEDWLNLNVLKLDKTKKSYLLLSGPTGSGKSITVNVLCKSKGISISEWINPVDQDYEYRGQSQMNQFLEFLVESKWGSLFETQNHKVTVVEDFPNPVIQRPEIFFDVLEECAYREMNPVIFICTESSSCGLNLVRTLFPESILTKHNITHISFNACATSLMKNVIKRAQTLVKEYPDVFRQPTSATIDAIIASGMGDIRNTLNQFHLASLLGAEEMPTISTILPKSGTKRKKNTKETKLKSMNRDDKLGLFHGLGRVLFPKRKEVGNNSWRLLHDVEKLVEEFFTQPTMFTSFLFENYLKYFGDITDVSKAAEILSFSATLLENNWDRQDTLIFGLWISVLGIMINNEHKVSKWNQITAPKKILVDNARCIEDLSIKSTDCFYYNLIKKSDKFHNFKTES